MTIQNNSFETVYDAGTYDRTGIPDQWTLTRGGTSWEWGEFDSITLYGEDFETGWSANEGRRTIFGGSELDDASFDSTGDAVEDFEEEWMDFIALTNDMAAQYELHRMKKDGVHGTSDGTNFISVTNPATNNAEAIALLNDLKAKYEAHRILTASSVHGVADNTNVVSSPNATDWATAQTLANDIRVKYEAHRILTSGVHGVADTFYVVTERPVEDSRRDDFSVGQLDDASFDVGTPEAFEDFEEEWNGNEGRRTVFGGGELDDASFDTTPEAFEDFEEEWNGNEGRRTVFGGGELDDAVFIAGGGTSAVETFGLGATLVVPAGVGIGAATPVEPTQPHRAAFTGTLTGTLELQVRRDGLATWETTNTITTVPVTIDLSTGLAEVRVERKTSGGTTSAAVLWQELTDL